MLYNKYTLILLFSFLMFSHNYAQIEFDGGYIKTQTGKFIELNEVQAYTLNILEISIKSNGFKHLESDKKYYYTVNKRNIKSIPQNDFKGIVIKGNYKFNYVSLHPLIEKRIGHNQLLSDNKGPATKYSPFFVPGEKIEVRKKSLGDNTYYWQPRYNLPQGEYVVWVGYSFWLFEIR